MGAKKKPQDDAVGRRRRWRSRRRDDGDRARAAARARRGAQDRGRRQRRRADRRVPRGEEARLMAGTLVFLEHHDGAIQKGALGVLAKAVQLDGAVTGVLIGSGVRDIADSAGAFGAATVFVADDERLSAPLPQPRVDVLAKLVRDEGFDTDPVRAVGARRRRRRRACRASRRRAELGPRRPDRGQRRQAAGACRLGRRRRRLVERREARDLPLRHVRCERDRRHGRGARRRRSSSRTSRRRPRCSSRRTRSSRGRRSRRPT